MPHLALPVCACFHGTSSEAPSNTTPHPHLAAQKNLVERGTLTELTLEPIGLPDLVDSDHWGAANFLQDVGQDLCFFWPEITQEKKKRKERCQLKATVTQQEPS